MSKHESVWSIIFYILAAVLVYLDIRILANSLSLNGVWFATAREGKRLAKQVRRGIYTRKDVEAALKEYGDAEPAIALQWLDKWGIE